MLCLQIRNGSITLPGMAAVSLALYSPATANIASGSSALSIVTFTTLDLEVAVTAPAGVGTVVDLSNVVDTTPPVISMLGDAFTTVLEGDRFTDPGVRVYDNIDGNSIATISRLLLCTRPAGDLASLSAADSRPLAG
jgi:zinc transporter 1/2/3